MENQNVTYAEKVDEANKPAEPVYAEKLDEAIKPAEPVYAEAVYAQPAAVKKSNSRTGIIIAVVIGAVILLAVIFGVIISSVMSNMKVGDIEDQIYAISGDAYECEEQIIEVYENYDKLSRGAKRKVMNRDTIIELYKQVEDIIESRKEAAAEVDNLIAAIDYTNVYTEASTLKPAVIAYNNLEEKAKDYLEKKDDMLNSYDRVGELYVEVTKENFYDLFNVSFSVGERTNYGSGISIDQDGYDIYIDDDDGRITPNYDINAHNDYATPVYIYVESKYPNLISNCYFGIHLHQTYTGLGIIDSDIHEFALQEGTISYDSSMGTGEYRINVENNDAGSGFLDWIGYSYDFSDMTHEMNPFDVSRVEIYSISGSVAY